MPPQRPRADASPSLDGSSAPVRPADPRAPTRYPAGQLHSPLTENVVANVQAIVSTSQRNLAQFMQFGDANCGTELMPFDPRNPYGLRPVPGVPSGSQPTIDYFSRQTIQGETAFLRLSLGCGESGTARDAVDGTSSPIVRETTINGAAFALVQFGNAEQGDMVQNPRVIDDNMYMEGFDRYMLEVVDELIARGVVPLVRTFPARVNCDHGCQAVHMGPMFATITRGIAEGRQIPFADLNVQLAMAGSKPGDYLNGNDGHFTAGTAGSADFRDMKLGYPNDVTLALAILDRMQQVAQGAWRAEPNPGPPRLGSGTLDEPFAVDTLPFTDLRDFRGAKPSPTTDYASCGAPKPIDGPAYFYRLEITSPTPVKVRLTNRMNSPAAAIVRHFVGKIDVAHCTKSIADGITWDNLYETTLAPGTHYFAVMSPKYDEGATPPEFLFVVQPCADDDLLCK
jgi:hypothetical protein